MISLRVLVPLVLLFATSLVAWSPALASDLRPLVLLSTDEMQATTGGGWHENSTCGLYAEQELTPCPGSELSCSYIGGNQCVNKEPYGYWTCVDMEKFRCWDPQLGPCYKQRTCNSDNGNCNYGKSAASWCQWWCYNDSAACGQFGPQGWLPMNACSWILMDYPEGCTP
jgi:hypothetical protein